MGRSHWRVVALAAFCFGGIGCMSMPDARYVYQDGEYGVIGIPRNSSLGKKNYRDQAHELMIKHFPEGYEIVRAEEVVEGDRTLDTARKVELDSEPGFAALNQMIKLGKFAQVTSLDQKDSVKITESRIIYRRKLGGIETGHDGFSALANLAPELYIDPNKDVRKDLKNAALLVKKSAASGPKTEDKEKQLADAKSKEATAVKVDVEVQNAGNPDPK